MSGKASIFMPDEAAAAALFYASRPELPHIDAKDAAILQMLAGRKKRHQLSPQQKEVLLSVWDVCEKPSHEERERLAVRLNMTNRDIQVWFQNRRAKLRRQHQGKNTPRRVSQPGVMSPSLAAYAGSKASTPALSASASAASYASDMRRASAPAMPYAATTDPYAMVTTTSAPTASAASLTSMSSASADLSKHFKRRSSQPLPSSRSTSALSAAATLNSLASRRRHSDPDNNSSNDDDDDYGEEDDYIDRQSTGESDSNYSSSAASSRRSSTPLIPPPPQPVWAPIAMRITPTPSPKPPQIHHQQFFPYQPPMMLQQQQHQPALRPTQPPMSNPMYMWQSTGKSSTDTATTDFAPLSFPLSLPPPPPLQNQQQPPTPVHAAAPEPPRTRVDIGFLLNS